MEFHRGADLFGPDISDWRDDAEFLRYTRQLSLYSLDKLRAEPLHLKEEQQKVLKSTQELAFTNYKTFIQTAECTNSISQEFTTVEGCVDQLLGNIPVFTAACKQFSQAAQDISTKQKLNSLALSKHTQLLEILEIPQLMETCVRNSYYEEALELYMHVRKMEKRFGEIVLIKAIGKEVEESLDMMLNLLLQQLHGSVQLPVCLKVIGYLRRMSVFSDVDLRLKFLQARNCWLKSVLEAIPKDDAYQHITKVIECSRIHLFDIITQYRAVFPDDDLILSTNTNPVLPSGDVALFYSWVNEKVWEFLQVLEEDLRQGVGTRIDSLLGQCMFFGQSFSRIGIDFRTLMIPVFCAAIGSSFKQMLRKAKHEFHDAMKSCTHLRVSTLPTNLPHQSYTNLALTPPNSILDNPPLANLTNALVLALNQLRQCAPFGLGPDVYSETRRLLESTLHDVKEYYRLEYSSFSSGELQAFINLVKVILSDFLPFIAKCIEAIFSDVVVEQVATVSTYGLMHQSSSTAIMNRARIDLDMNLDILAIGGTLQDILPKEDHLAYTNISDIAAAKQLVGTVNDESGNDN